MSLKQLFFLVSAFAVVALVSYVYYFNQTPVTLHWAPGSSVQASLALTLIVTFSAGLLLASVFAFFFHTLHRIGDWQIQKRIKRASEHQELLVEGREALAAGDFSSANNAFERVLREDPESTLARSMLAEAAIESGDFEAASKVIDEARQSQKDNLELLFQAATANAELGNFTAAYDSLSLILKADPKNIYALDGIVEASIQLKRFDEALERQKQLVKRSSGEERSLEQNRLAEIELLSAEYVCSNDQLKLKDKVEVVLREHRDFPPALSKLATLEREAGKIKEAIRLWTRAYRESGKAAYLESIAETWLNIDQPSKALSAVKEALGNGSRSDSVVESLFLAKLFLHLEMLEEAEKELEALSPEAKLKTETYLQHALIKARLLRRQGKDEDGLSQLLRVAEDAGLFEQHSLFIQNEEQNTHMSWIRHSRARRLPPSPRLSTP